MIPKHARPIVLALIGLYLFISGCAVNPFGQGVYSSNQNFFSGFFGGNNSFYTMSAPGNTAGSLWLATKMDQYHNAFDVYSDFGSGGNHFVVKALLDNTNMTFREDDTNSPYSGDTAIKITFNPGASGAGNYMTGTAQDGITVDTSTLVSSGEAIPHLAIRTLASYYTNSLKFADANHTNGSAHRYDYNTDKDGGWMEGTAYMALAYLFNSNIIKGTNVIHAMTNGNRGSTGGIYASTKDQLTTGFVDANGSNLVIYRRQQVAATALSVLADMKQNPYWVGNAVSNIAGTRTAPKGTNYLQAAMDQYHSVYYVYKDANCGGNHFDQRGVMNLVDTNIMTYTEQETNVKYSGVTGIKVTLAPSASSKWVGLYYMNGVLNGTNRNPEANWGNFTNAGNTDITGSTYLYFYARGAAGGENVTFFTLGIGRNGAATNTDPNTGLPFKYPDSNPQITTNVTLTTTWTLYRITISGANLSYVLGGFGWSAANQTTGNKVFYIDQIYINKSTATKPRLIETFTVQNSAYDFDRTMANMAHTYDNSLAALAFLASGDTNRARLIIDALIYCQTNDRYYTDNRLRNAYMAGDLILPKGWNPNGKSNTVRSPGWWDNPHYNWFEDGMAVGSSLEANAWAMLAMLSWYDKFGGAGYLDAAQKIGNWIENNLPDGRGYGGYKNGFLGWEPSPTADMGKSIMANSAVYAAFKRLYAATGNAVWNTRTAFAKTYIDSLWTVGTGLYFMNGQLLSGANQASADTNWGMTPNAGWNLNGATKLEFYAKGSLGGEKVEFFVGGIGRTASGGSNATYPDSMTKTSTGTLTLSSSWTKYTISLSGKDLSYVLGGFGFYTVSSATNQVNFYIDDVKYDLPRLSEGRFIASFAVDQRQSTNISQGSDRVLKGTSFIYDQAMSILAYLAVGENTRAQQVADALIYARTNDRYYTDGRFRNAYSSGDLVSWPGWKPNGKTGVVRTPGFWDYTSNSFFEDKYAVGTATGNVAWVMIALLSYYQKVGGQPYLDTAIAIGDWVHASNWSATGLPGYTGGFDGWEPTPTKHNYKSTEHNLDLYAAYTRLYQITGTAKWAQYATNCYTFVTNMWDPVSNCFYTGTGNDGVTIAKDVIPVDTQTWTHLSLRNLNGAMTNSLAFAESNHMVVSNYAGVTNWGYDFDRDKDGMWFEGTGQMATGYMLKGLETKASYVLNAIHNIGQQADGGVIAASKDQLTTAFEVSPGIMWYYFKREAVGATTWAVMADKRVNAFWIGTAYEYLPVVTNQYEMAFNTASITPEISVNDLFVYNSKLHTSHWDWGNTYAYDGTVWTNAANNTPYHGINPSANNYFTYNDGSGTAMYIVVYSGAYGGLTRMYKWVNSSWNVVYGLPTADANGYVSNYMGSPVVYNNNLYLAADYDDYLVSGTNFPTIYKHTPGTGWSVSMSNIYIQPNHLIKMIVYNDGSGDKLYAFANTNYGYYYGGDALCWVYNGTSWGSPIEIVNSTGYIYSLCVFNSQLYVGVENSGVWVYSGGTFSRVFYTTGWPCDPNSMCVWNNKLYVGFSDPGCYLYSHSGSTPSANWNLEIAMTNWTYVPIKVNSMAVYNNYLYLGIQFSPYRNGMITETSGQVFRVLY